MNMAAQANSSLLAAQKIAAGLPGAAAPSAPVPVLSALAAATQAAAPLLASPPTPIVPPAFPVAPAAPSAPKLPTRIYVGSVDYQISEADVQKIFSAFGAMKKCEMLTNPEKPGTHRGYGFIDFESHESADLAIKHMNNFELAGRNLKVSWASGSTGSGSSSSGAGASAAAAAAAVASGLPQLAIPPAIPTKESLSAEENSTLRSSSDRAALMQKLAASHGANVAPPAPVSKPITSRVVVLRNMVGPNDIDEGLTEEVTDECGHYGNVEWVLIYKERQSENEDDVIVKIFVVFSDLVGCQKAINALNGRWFAGRKVVAESYPEDKFNIKDYTL
eukprot:GILI01009879.1.p1 GENE.GILI01009879.1~~GILI01009879.1.p1  ORF type:complete len:389 (-),score=138.15 GILI01009879.1:202-1200(-)